MKGLIIWGLLATASFGYYKITEVERDDTGVIVGEGTIDAFSMQLGDCFNDGSDIDVGETVEVFGVAGVPCGEAHDNEVFALVELDIDEFPGEEMISGLAFDSCLVHFEPFVGRNYESSALDIFTLYPTQASWLQNDREVVCALYDMELNKLVGSVQGSSL